MDNALKEYMRKEYNLMIGDSTAEKIKKEIGTAIPTNSNTYPVKGRDIRSGTPKEVNITEEDSSEALNGILRVMVNGIKDALENTPPGLSADLVDIGLTLTGGGALLKNIDKRFSKERLKCKGNKDNKILKIYEICNNNAAANNCKYNNTTNYKGNGVYEKWYLGKMEVNLNDGKKKKYLYFQFN